MTMKVAKDKEPKGFDTTKKFMLLEKVREQDQLDHLSLIYV